MSFKVHTIVFHVGTEHPCPNSANIWTYLLALPTRPTSLRSGQLALLITNPLPGVFVP